MGNNLYRRKEEESKRMYYLGEEKKSYLATEYVYLVQRTMYGAAWLVQQCTSGRCNSGRCVNSTVGSVVIGAAEVGVTSGVLYGAVLVQQWLV